MAAMRNDMVLWTKMARANLASKLRPPRSAEAIGRELDVPLKLWRDVEEADERVLDFREDKQKAEREKAAKPIEDALHRWHEDVDAGWIRVESHAAREMKAQFLGGRRSEQDVASRIESALIRAEVRRQAAGLGAQGLELLYRAGSPLVRQALEEAPEITVKGGIPTVRASLVPAELVESVLLADAEKHSPELARELEDAKLVRSTFHSAYQMVLREIERVSGRPIVARPIAAAR